MPKQKRLTIAEKKLRAKVRAELRAKGLIPQVKPKLNRKKFAAEVIKDYEQNLNKYSDISHLYDAISWMLPSTEYKQKISEEQVGVLKVLKLAIEIKKFKEDKIKIGESKYTIGEIYEKVIGPVIKL